VLVPEAVVAAAVVFQRRAPGLAPERALRSAPWRLRNPRARRRDR
jgi:hypothetical protein